MRSLLALSFGGLFVLVTACADDGGLPGGEEETATDEQAVASLERVPGLVMGLLHNLNQGPVGKVMYSAYSWEAKLQHGGDLGAPNHRGFDWWTLSDPSPALDPSSYASRLPPGVVVALKHNANQSGQIITAFGRDAWSGPSSFPGFTKQVGGDRGASSGVGYAWYESTGSSFTKWSEIDWILPKYTVVGLKHSQNQSSKVLRWNGVTYDPVKTSPVPPGFRRMVGGDLGAPNGQGFYWYEKTTGTEIVTEPTLKRTLSRSMFLASGDSGSNDRDGDCLVDSMESQLANLTRPLARFDKQEHAREPLEPIVVFRVYPTSASTVHVKWLVLFREDGGYGPADASCWGWNGHAGDNDSIDYDLKTTDGGRSWTVTKVEVGDKGLNWPGRSRLEVYDKYYPIVYMSDGKHHEYFNSDNDLQDSIYSEVPLWDDCDDDVDGLGIDVHTNATSLLGPGNNVGEPGYHPALTFADTLDPDFPTMHVWGAQNFYSMSPNEGKLPVVTFPACPSNGCSHSPCMVGPALSTSCFGDAAYICQFDPYCCNNYWDSICVGEVPSSCW